MPELVKKYHVYVVEYRGMGSSDKPPTGYDKKTLSSDIHALVKELGYDKVHMAGHDIGAQVAYAYAAQFPEATTKLVMMDVPHPFEGFLSIPLLPPPGVYVMSDKERPIYPWWFSLNSVPDLPEKLLQGKQMSIFQDWLFYYLAFGGKPPMTQETKDIYYSAYSSPDAIRASNGWYNTFRQDIDDLKTYKKLSVPALGIAGWDSTAHTLEEFLKQNATDMKMVKINKAGHWISEQSPQETVKLLTEFFGT